ncbi:MAG TPA: hypothetical protein PKL28_13215 [Rhodocyclaceae bacterium]|jgi:hypothetical protein|nr:hypothetical protein [Rhodocyclaceae bacterium]HNM82010.1 hypothetical protein [Rhodocyclaceae bacterium]HNO89309.1 hypothetical protein [Rhodocyclaceae bacterium]
MVTWSGILADEDLDAGIEADNPDADTKVRTVSRGWNVPAFWSAMKTTPGSFPAA